MTTRSGVSALAAGCDDVDGCVGAEVGDPPAAGAKDETERQQPEVVILGRRAGQHGERARAAAPAAREGEESSMDEIRREVLLGDPDLAALPAGAELAQVREDQVAKDELEREGREGPVERCVGARLVVALERRPESGCNLGKGSCDGGKADRLASVLERARAGDARGLGRGDAGGEKALHLANPLHVRLGVQAEAAGGPGRLEQPVAALPRPQQLAAHACPATELADP